MKFKILISTFSGVKYLVKPDSPTKSDYKYAKIIETDKRFICSREFNLKNTIIKFDKPLKWGNIWFFWHDEYRCLIKENHIKEIK